MSVTESKMIAVRGQFREGGKQDFEIRYRVHTSALQSPLQTWLDGMTASPNPLPAINTAFPGSPKAFCKEISIDQEHERNPHIWIATVSYGELQEDQDNTSEDPFVQDNPLDRDTVWRVEWDVVQEIVSEDRNGEQIVNSAGQPFDEALLEDRHLAVMVGRKNYETEEEIRDIGTEYDRAVNSAVFRGEAVRTVKFDGVGCSDPQWENGIRFYEATFRFSVKAETWDRKVLDRGFSYLDAGKLKNIRDDDGQLITEPALLDGSGGKLAVGQVGVALTFQANPQKDFNALGL